MPQVQSISEVVARFARDAGFDVAGVAPVAEFPELARFPEWLAAGRAGEMRWLESRDEFGRLKREAIANAAPWARSVVVCAINYNTRHPYSTDPHGGSEGWISRYAWSQSDYHQHVLEKLRTVEAVLRREVSDPALRTWCYVDTGPVIERVVARYAGIGWIGKNTCLINQQSGSWLFLGVILTSLDLAPNLPAADRCGTCTRCLEACPTNAFVAPYELDASRCISYLTIEKRGSIPEDLREGMGRHVFGCDICQDVCPWNNQKKARAPATSAPEFQPRPGLVNPSLEWLATISEEDFRRTFKDSPIKRTKRTGIRRNAIVAIGNSGRCEYIPLLRRLAEDPDVVISEHARWALERFERSGSQSGHPETSPS